MSVSVGAHLSDSVGFLPTIHAPKNRATLTLEAATGPYVTVFGDRDNLARLRDALVELVAGLDAEKALLAARMLALDEDTDTTLDEQSADSAA